MAVARWFNSLKNTDIKCCSLTGRTWTWLLTLIHIGVATVYLFADFVSLGRGPGLVRGLVLLKGNHILGLVLGPHHAVHNEENADHEGVEGENRRMMGTRKKPKYNLLQNLVSQMPHHLLVLHLYNHPEIAPPPLQADALSPPKNLQLDPSPLLNRLHLRPRLHQLPKLQKPHKNG